MTEDDLRTLELAPTARRRTVLLRAGALAAAAVVGAVLVVGVLDRRQDADTTPIATAVPVPSSTTSLPTAPPSPPTSTPPVTPSGSPSTPTPTPTPTPPLPPQPSATRAQQVLGLVLDVPVDWQLDPNESGGDTACVGPPGDECGGVWVSAAGDLVTVDDYFREPCVVSGPTPVQLDELMTNYGTFGGGTTGGVPLPVPRMVLEDPFWSLWVSGAQVDEDQARAVASVRFAPPPS